MHAYTHVFEFFLRYGISCRPVWPCCVAEPKWPWIDPPASTNLDLHIKKGMNEQISDKPRK